MATISNKARTLNAVANEVALLDNKVMDTFKKILCLQEEMRLAIRARDAAKITLVSLCKSM